MGIEKKSDNKPGKSTRIVLVDDHSMFREGLVEVLSREPDLEICGQAEDSRQALEVIKVAKPDLAIVDLVLKNSHGIELIKDIRALHPKVAVLVVSMHQESLFAERALRAGARGYITKQEATKHLIGAIRKVIAGEVVASDSLTQIALGQLAGGEMPAKSQSVGRLSDREVPVLELMGNGFNNHQIAERLRIDVTTIETYRARIKEKLVLKDATELLQYAIRWAHRDPI
jgi:DNA-binding NarL/FixJ family response regulator